MSETIIVALISLLGTLGGTFGGIVVSNRLTNFRLEQLEKKVEKHNSVIERTYDLEEKQAVQNEKINEVEKKIGELEALHNRT